MCWRGLCTEGGVGNPYSLRLPQRGGEEKDHTDKEDSTRAKKAAGQGKGVLAARRV